MDIKEGDKLTYKLEKGKIVLEPIISIPRSQAYFWTPEVQEKVKKAEENFKSGNFKTHEIDKFVKELKDSGNILLPQSQNFSHSMTSYQKR